MDKKETYPLRVIISGGGTGGHIFPALSIADELKDRNPATEILFVGANGRMEMEKVPAAGYKIIALDVAGLKRSLSPGNLALPLKYASSILKAGKILKEFSPDVVVGVGGYASAPVLWSAQMKRIPTLIQEQNSFAGLTNKILGKRAGCICVAFDSMERFFPAGKIVLTGNPIRSDIVPPTAQTRAEGAEFYGLDQSRKHILIIGGSLGSRTLNNAVMAWISDGCPGCENTQVLWQCGKHYKAEVDEFIAEHPEVKGIVFHSDFLSRMSLAYACADVIVSRSGASSVSEICASAGAAVLVPSPNVTEDHQSHNAMALVRNNAGVLVRDCDAMQLMMKTACGLLLDEQALKRMSENALKLARRNAASDIADEVYKLLKK